MTHGGGNSVVESIYYGKPMICYPLAVDQHGSCFRVHDMGAGISVTENPTVQKIESAITQINLNKTEIKRL